jgi:hypothetical protein
MVIVDLALATICFAGQCHPVLVGADTPKGTFQLEHVLTRAQGYGGDVLVYKETPRWIYAVHRVYTLIPAQHRIERLQSADPRQRETITMGCINVMPDVYERLVDCCANDALTIR